MAGISPEWLIASGMVLRLKVVTAPSGTSGRHCEPGKGATAPTRPADIAAAAPVPPDIGRPPVDLRHLLAAKSLAQCRFDSAAVTPSAAAVLRSIVDFERRRRGSRSLFTPTKVGSPAAAYQTRRGIRQSARSVPCRVY